MPSRSDRQNFPGQHPHRVVDNHSLVNVLVERNDHDGTDFEVILYGICGQFRVDKKMLVVEWMNNGTSPLAFSWRV